MTSKQDKLEAAAAGVGEKLTRARTPRPKRQAFAGLVSVDSATPVEEPSNVVEELVEEETVRLAEAVDVLEGEVSKPEPAPARKRTRSVPPWTTLCIPPARRGTAGMQRRYNIPISYAVMQQLNTLDMQQLQAGEHKINRSALFEAAIDTYAADQAYWVGEWEGSDPEPSTTALQGRVDDATLNKVNALRYLEVGGKVRSVNPGPVLALIIQRILG